MYVTYATIALVKDIMGSLFNLPSSENSRLESRWNTPAPHGYFLHLEGFSSSTETLRAGRASGSEEQTISKDVSSRFGRRLRELRRERDLTQSDMAKRFGIDRSFISDVERGRKSISLPMLEVIALGMKVTLSQLFEDI